MNVQHKVKGFTIIEVVLVLAIAGLIFLMVFIALPALQSSQRDTARKNDVSTVASAISTYTGNNRGQFPTTAKLSGYVQNISSNTTQVTVEPQFTDTLSVSDGQILVTQQSTCDTTGAGKGTASQKLIKASSARQFTVVTYLEAGGGTTYCQDS